MFNRLRNNPKNVSLEDLISLLASYGIILERVRGSHHVFNAQVGDKVYTLPIPFQRPLKAIYVKKALELIELIEAAQQNGEDDDDDKKES